MIKLMYALRRKPDVSAAQFHKYWLETHAPLVLEVAGKKIGMQRYVQSHTILTPADDALQAPRDSEIPPFDGVAEVWFNSVDDITKAWTSPQGLAAGKALIEDEHHFIDVRRSPIWIVEEHVIISN